MPRLVSPWKNVALEMVGFVPDSVRHRVYQARHGVKTLTTEKELDTHLAQAAELFPRNDDEARRFLTSFEFAAPSMPADPFSPAYARAQSDLYRLISGRDHYDTDNEDTDIDLGCCVSAPYPYSTGSSIQVADQLAACSFILRALNPQPRQRVVEFGPGWGNLTLPLAMLGVDVTAVEVSATFGELLRQRAVGNDHLTVVESDMLDYHPEQPFDAAVFFESFHHCSDHLQMLSNLRSTVSPAGRLVFAAEPVTWMPYPWGLRLNGLSLWCTRTYGWLELGFDNHYFREALARTGWQGHRRRSRSMGPLADVILAQRSSRT